MLEHYIYCHVINVAAENLVVSAHGLLICLCLEKRFKKKTISCPGNIFSSLMLYIIAMKWSDMAAEFNLFQNIKTRRTSALQKQQHIIILQQ